MLQLYFSTTNIHSVFVQDLHTNWIMVHIYLFIFITHNTQIMYIYWLVLKWKNVQNFYQFGFEIKTLCPPNGYSNSVLSALVRKKGFQKNSTTKYRNFKILLPNLWGKMWGNDLVSENKMQGRRRKQNQRILCDSVLVHAGMSPCICRVRKRVQWVLLWGGGGVWSAVRRAILVIIQTCAVCLTVRISI